MSTVFITGGTRGIGAACVKLFAKQGHRVAFVYRESEALAQSLARETGALPHRADVTDRAQLDEIVRSLGHVDVLIANAGIAEQKQFQDITSADWQRMLDVNLTGTFHAVQAVLPGMLSKKQGVILTVSSIWGLVGASCEAHYSASKGAIIALTKALAKELGPSGIRANCVAPGVIETDMIRDLSGADRQALIEETPLGRLGTPEDIAQALLFLASDAAGFITGQVLGANGGFLM